MLIDPVTVRATADSCSIDEAQLRILSAVTRTETTEIPLASSLGRATASDIVATMNQPPFATAAMDGWAVHGDQAGLYRLVGESRAGRGYGQRLATGEAVLISTGAPLPDGATRVVRREDGEAKGSRVRVSCSITGRVDIRLRGSDFQRGRVLVPARRRIDHLDMARLAASGIARVTVRSLPSAAVYTTGDELTAGGRPHEDQICDSLSVALKARIAQIGASIASTTILADDADVISSAAARSNAEVLVFIGGASKGQHNCVKSGLAALGLELMFGSVRMRPGKPAWCGRLGDGRLVIGLPGNPVAALIAAELFLVPLIRASQGLDPIRREILLPQLAAVEGGMDRVAFAHAGLDERGRFDVAILGGQDSAALAPLLSANAIVRCSKSIAGYRAVTLLSPL